MLTATGVTAAISEWVLGFTKEPWVFLLLANLLMLFVGCFLEPTAAITILVLSSCRSASSWASTWSISAW
jgi:TRAP-type C4-dicarboxylate transport system permease large subunit